MIDELFRSCDDGEEQANELRASMREEVRERFGEDFGGPRKFIPE